jgi:hypothetical protein
MRCLSVSWRKKNQQKSRIFPSHGENIINRLGESLYLMEGKESTDIQNLSISWRENNQQMIFRIFPTHRRKYLTVMQNLSILWREDNQYTCRIFPTHGKKIVNRYAESFHLREGKYIIKRYAESFHLREGKYIIKRYAESFQLMKIVNRYANLSNS